MVVLTIVIFRVVAKVTNSFCSLGRYGTALTFSHTLTSLDESTVKICDGNEPSPSHVLSIILQQEELESVAFIDV